MSHFIFLGLFSGVTISERHVVRTVFVSQILVFIFGYLSLILAMSACNLQVQVDSCAAVLYCESNHVRFSQLLCFGRVLGKDPGRRFICAILDLSGWVEFTAMLTTPHEITDTLNQRHK